MDGVTTPVVDFEEYQELIEMELDEGAGEELDEGAGFRSSTVFNGECCGESLDGVEMIPSHEKIR